MIIVWSTKLRNLSLNNGAKFSEKLVFLTPWYVRAYQGVRNVSFSKDIGCVLNEWSLMPLEILIEIEASMVLVVFWACD